MSSNFKHISIVVASLVLIGCGGGGSSTETPAAGTPVPTGNTDTPTTDNTTSDTTTTTTDNTGSSGSTGDTTEPVFKSFSSYSSVENKKYVSYIEADDESEISYSIVSGVDKDKFSIDSHDGTLIFKDFPDYEIPDDADGDNIYEVTVKAIDSSNNEASQDITVSLDDIDENIPKTYKIETLSNGANNYDVGTTPKSLYILFSNYDTSSDSSPSVSHNPKIASSRENKIFSTDSLLDQPKTLHAPRYVQQFNSDIRTLFKPNASTSKHQSKILPTTTEKNEDVASDSQIFYLDTGTSNTTTATARKIVSNVSTAFGNKALNIWVSNDSFDSGSGCSKTKCVTQTMVNALADTFLKTNSSDNDIYDWVTNIYGEEWSSDAQIKYNDLIGENDEITILLTDIDGDDSPTGGVIGYFWAKDNIKSSTISGSNERVMFYADAVMFANGEGTWDIDDFWPKEMVSTLAHEFQHMIHFYQKTVLRDASTDTWINEMLSETTEDLIATKIQHSGPRGVEYTDGSAGNTGNQNGRYPLFNTNNTLSLTAWNNNLADYSKVNAFGTFLTRNYGGAKVLHDIMHNNLEHEDAIEAATGKSFNTLLREWGISVLLSDRVDTTSNQYSYNTNDFTVSEKEKSIYKMGAINFFNYDPQPIINTNIGTVKAQGNYYYKVGDNLTGMVDIDLTLDTNTEATLIVK